MKSSLKGVLTAGGVSLLTANLCGQTAQPNIVLINIDDLGWADLSSQGSGYYQTPNIDRLRSEGVFFDHAYAGAPNSAPSRACLMTGLNTPRHGVYTVSPPDRGRSEDRKLIPYPNRTVPDSTLVLLPEALHRQGYSTFHIGKWHLGVDPTEQGFDRNIGGNMAGNPSTYFSPYGNKNLPDGADGEFLTDRLTDEAIGLIDSRDRSKPFFLYFATYAVHTPLEPKPELEAKYHALPTTEAHSNAKYAALIESTDSNIGRLLAHLESCGLTDNTVVVLITDNGGVYDISRQWPLRAGKGSFYEGGIRTPMIVRWSGHTEPGRTDSRTITQMDLYPTLLDIAGGRSSKAWLDGVDIRAAIEGGKQADLKRRALYWHFPAYLENGNRETVDMKFRTRPVSVILKGDWKLIYSYESGRTELYNIRDDVSEHHDLSESHKRLTRKLLRQLQRWLVKTGAPTSFEPNPLYRDPTES